MTKITEVKSVLAKLLATENLTVEYANVDTASFDVKNRILRIPTMKDLDAKTLDLFVGHEVAHALWTPCDGMENLPIKTQNFHSVLNVVEDARIERLIQKKYPGLKKPFYQAYTQLHENNFFGTEEMNIADLLLIDRINLKAKLGTQTNIELTGKEKEFFDRAMTTQTFDEVIKLSEELFEYCQQELEEKNSEEDPTPDATPDMSAYMQGDEQEQNAGGGNGADEGDGKGMNAVQGSDDQDADEQGQANSADTEEDADEDTVQTKAPNLTDNMNGKAEDTDGSAPGVKSITDMASNKNTKKFVETDENAIPRYYDIPKTINIDKVVIPFTTVHSEMLEHWGNTERVKTLLTKTAKEFKKKNDKVINYLHKEFEMKKAADIYARANTTKTGVINSNLLYSYKYNEDIFMKKTVLPNGKNHGMVFFLDWSGSMSDNMKGTMEQLLCLALFCKKAQIPFSAYAFSSEYYKRTQTPLEQVQSLNMNELNVSGVSLLELFNDKMNNVQFNKAVELCVALSNMYSRKYGYGDFAYMGLPRKYYLGGTPLDATIIIAHRLVPEFQKRMNVQVMNVCFLTDGSSHTVNGCVGYNKFGGVDAYTVTADVSGRGNMFIRDKSTGTLIKSVADQYNRGDMTKALYLSLKKSTGVNTMGFHLVGQRNEMRYAYDKYIAPTLDNEITRYTYFDDWRKSFNKNKCDTSTVSGLDELYIIKGGKALEVDDEGLDVEVGASKQKLTTAFKKAAQGKLQNRAVLSKFIENIAA
jgi:hypothetical protein